MNKKLCIRSDDAEWDYIDAAWVAMKVSYGFNFHKQFSKKYHGRFIFNPTYTIFRFNNVEAYTLFLLEWS